MLQWRRVHISLAQTGYFCSPHPALFTYGASMRETQAVANMQNTVQKQRLCNTLQMLISYFTQLAFCSIWIVWVCILQCLDLMQQHKPMLLGTASGNALAWFIIVNIGQNWISWIYRKHHKCQWGSGKTLSLHSHLQIPQPQITPIRKIPWKQSSPFLLFYLKSQKSWYLACCWGNL